MKSKILVLVIIIALLLTGCKKDALPEEAPSEIKEVEIYEPTFKVEKVPITPENFMEKIALLNIALESKPLEDSQGLYLEKFYDGEYEDTYAMYSVYTDESDAVEQFNYFRFEYADLAMSSTGELIEDSENTFIVKNGSAFVGFKKEKNTFIFISTNDRAEEAEKVFACF